MSRAAALTQAEWCALIRPDISYAAKGIRTAPLGDLLEAHWMGGQRWTSQFIFGFPIVSTLAQTGVSHYPKIATSIHFPVISFLWLGSEVR